MSIVSVAYSGYRKFKAKRKNLTIVIIGSFFLILVFLSLFEAMEKNLWTFWVANFVGGNIAVKKEIRDFDMFQPITPEGYFDYAAFPKPGTSPRLRFGGLLEKDGSASVVIIGIDSAREQNRKTHINVYDGNLLSGEGMEILVPEKIMSMISAKTGDKIVLYAQTRDGYQNYGFVKIEGVLDPVPALDLIMGGSFICYMPIQAVREFLGTGENEVSEVLLGREQTRVAGYTVVNGLYSFAIVRVLAVIFLFLKTIILSFVLIFSINAVYHNVMLLTSEREVEIGLYLTYGAKALWIGKLFFIELFIYSLYCSLIGSVLAVLFTLLVNVLNIRPIDTATNILLSTDRFTLSLNGWNVGMTYAIIFALLLFGSFIPIRNCISNMNIVNIFSNTKR